MARQSTVRQRTPAVGEDTFVSGVLEATDWTRRHGRIILGAILALVVIIAGVVYYRSYRSALENKAAGDLDQIRSIAASGNIPLAQRQLTQFIARYSSTHAGEEARVLMAQALLEQGNAKGAIPIVDPLATDLDKPLGPTAGLLLGAAYEGSGDYSKAIATYTRIGEKAPYQFQRRDALEDAARLKLQHNDATGAAAIYKQILASMPDTATGRAVYEMRLAQAQAGTQGGARK